MAFPSKQKAIYDRLVREIAERYPPGAKLPPERALAARLGIARMTLRGAMARLAREGRIERNVRGTFASGENPPPALGEKRRIVHVLLPCPDYTVRSGASSCSAVRSLIRGAVRAALRYDAQVVTIPVSDTNDPAAFDRNQLAPLRKNDIVLFVGSWYENLFPLLAERQCRVGFIVNGVERIPACFRNGNLAYCVFSRPILANYLPEALRHAKRLRFRKVLLFLRRGFSLCRYRSELLDAALRKESRASLPMQLKTFICRNDASLAEECARIRSLYERETFDALIFDAETKARFPLSLHRLCNLPPHVAIYVRGIDFLCGSAEERQHLYFSRPAFCECGSALAAYFLSGDRHGGKILNFRHILVNGDKIWRRR